MPNEILNRVAQSNIINLDPADFYPKFNIQTLDIKPWLFQGLLLKEKDFREHLAGHNWQQYQGAHVAVYCSADAIIPQWAHMLLAVYLQQANCTFMWGSKQAFIERLMLSAISAHDFSSCQGKPVIIKGCGQYPIPDSAYVAITQQLYPIAKSIMYGEACSTVPIYKQKK